jgi:hypothetical protein
MIDGESHRTRRRSAKSSVAPRKAAWQRALPASYDWHMHSLTEALRCLEQGEWEKAHAIVQNDESPLASWMHGVVHLQQGDLDNARYWYTRARRPLPDPSEVRGELRALGAALLAIQNPTGG